MPRELALCGYVTGTMPMPDAITSNIVATRERVYDDRYDSIRAAARTGCAGRQEVVPMERYGSFRIRTRQRC